MSRLAAVILAAGLSSRMGRFKPLLPLGGGTVLSTCVQLFLGGAGTQGRTGDGEPAVAVPVVDDVLVVTGSRAAEVAAEARRCGARAVHNPEHERGMFSSVLAGVAALPEDIDGFFLLPVDLPLVRSLTLVRLRESFLRHAPPVLYPVFRGERGHPPVISARLVPEILRHHGEGGLRRVLERHDHGALEMPTVDYGTMRDLDHPGDYARALELVESAGEEERGSSRGRAGRAKAACPGDGSMPCGYARRNAFPCDEECEALWELHRLPERIRRHCRAVARVAEAICDGLNSSGAGPRLNRALVRSAALMHDVGKGTKRHEAAGAERLREHGFEDAAVIAAEHFDMRLAQDEPVTESVVVFLADKLVRGERAVPLGERYGSKLDAYGHIPEAREAILGRLGRAREVLDRVSREMGACAEAVAVAALCVQPETAAPRPKTPAQAAGAARFQAGTEPRATTEPQATTGPRAGNQSRTREQADAGQDAVHSDRANGGATKDSP